VQGYGDPVANGGGGALGYLNWVLQQGAHNKIKDLLFRGITINQSFDL